MCPHGCFSFRECSSCSIPQLWNVVIGLVIAFVVVDILTIGMIVELARK